MLLTTNMATLGLTHHLEWVQALADLADSQMPLATFSVIFLVVVEAAVDLTSTADLT